MEFVSSSMSTPVQAEAIQRFWDKYHAALHDSGIHPPTDRWYVKRSEAYIEAHSGRRLSEQSPSDVTGYLAELGRLGRLEDWQFRQAVDALQKLFELVGASWLHEVDWAYWRESARSLPADHPTLARSVPLGERGLRWASTRLPVRRSSMRGPE